MFCLQQPPGRALDEETGKVGVQKRLKIAW